MSAAVDHEADALGTLFAIAEQIDALDGQDRHRELLAFARSAWWQVPLTLEEGLPGKITREAAAALQRELAAVTPGKVWFETPYGHKRRAIEKALRIDGSERFSGYATAAFRLIQTAEDEHWIAGAVGCPPDLKGTAAWLAWQHLDIDEVILWNPRSNALRIMGQAKSATSIVLPAHVEDRLTVYSDGFAFFRAWADNRASLAAAHVIAKQQRYAIVPTDAVDSSIPGALVIGDIAKIKWSDIGANVLVAGAGVDPVRLDRAVYASARLPRVEAAPQMRRAA